jgi:hypothetical protein
MKGLATDESGLAKVGTNYGALSGSLGLMFSRLICESTDALLEVVWEGRALLCSKVSLWTENISDWFSK